MKTNKNKTLVNLTWSGYEKLLKRLVNQIREYQPDVIIANARGGLPMGVHLAHLLNLGTKKFGFVMVIRHEDDKVASSFINPKIEGHWFPKVKGKRVLIVEDTIGTGKTLNTIREFIAQRNPREIRAVSLFLNKRNLDKTWITYGQVSTDRDWIVFPWEK